MGLVESHEVRWRTEQADPLHTAVVLMRLRPADRLWTLLPEMLGSVTWRSGADTERSPAMWQITESKAQASGGAFMFQGLPPGSNLSGLTAPVVPGLCGRWLRSFHRQPDRLECRGGSVEFIASRLAFSLLPDVQWFIASQLADPTSDVLHVRKHQVPVASLQLLHVLQIVADSEVSDWLLLTGGISNNDLIEATQSLTTASYSPMVTSSQELHWGLIKRTWDLCQALAAMPSTPGQRVEGLETRTCRGQCSSLNNVPRGGCIEMHGVATLDLHCVSCSVGHCVRVS